MHREIRRELKDSCTWAESSEYDTTIYPEKVLIMDAVDDYSLADQEEAFLDKYITTVIFDSNHAAQKNGVSATKEFCTNHEFTAQIPSIGKVYTFPTCKTEELYYYSCRICGKCEFNPNHVDYDHDMLPDEIEALKRTFGLNSSYDTEFPNDNSYIGVNAAGQHVWWLSCKTCGRAYKYDNTYVTEKAFKAAKFPMMDFNEYKTAMMDSLKQREEQILNSTAVMPQTFTLSRKSNVNMSKWAQSDVNFALNDNLIDDNVLGWDYTQNISRL